MTKSQGMKDFEKRVLGYAKEAGLVEKYGFKNGSQVLDALERFGSDPKNREAIRKYMEKKKE